MKTEFLQPAVPQKLFWFFLSGAESYYIVYALECFIEEFPPRFYYTEFALKKNRETRDGKPAIQHHDAEDSQGRGRAMVNTARRRRPAGEIAEKEKEMGEGRVMKLGVGMSPTKQTAYI